MRDGREDYSFVDTYRYLIQQETKHLRSVLAKLPEDNSPAGKPKVRQTIMERLNSNKRELARLPTYGWLTEDKTEKKL
jgi:hypothetical protein